MFTPIPLPPDTGPLFFALNVEDPSQCSPPDYEAELGAAAAAAAANTQQQQGKEQQQPQAPKGRLDRATAAVRDQHVTLRPASLIAMIKQVRMYLYPSWQYALCVHYWWKRVHVGRGTTAAVRDQHVPLRPAELVAKYARHPLSCSPYMTPSAP